ncbi:hypothetical protein FHX37_2817 [Haloactinospora alba]|uniref:Uncharacterized protein n=1 Tax=Haloactinospora alba TaxID=405555 RepID=A0A543NLX6_9ACTN|nr:hypothetical protein FHX37_2817 [Haloactinospora alba]
MKEFYPDPPHLTLAIYSLRPEHTCFHRMCELMSEFRCEYTGRTQVVPWPKTFTSPSDLVDKTFVLETSDGREEGTTRYPSGAGRPIRAAYRHRRFGTVIVEYLPGSTVEATRSLSPYMQEEWDLPEMSQVRLNAKARKNWRSGAKTCWRRSWNTLVPYTALSVSKLPSLRLPTCVQGATRSDRSCSCPPLS